jgi:hypothetical protein
MDETKKRIPIGSPQSPRSLGAPHVFVDGIGKSAVVVKSPAVCGVSGSVMTACTRVSIPTSVNSYGNTSKIWRLD